MGMQKVLQPKMEPRKTAQTVPDVPAVLAPNPFAVMAAAPGVVTSTSLDQDYLSSNFARTGAEFATNNPVLAQKFQQCYVGVLSSDISPAEKTKYLLGLVDSVKNIPGCRDFAYAARQFISSPAFAAGLESTKAEIDSKKDERLSNAEKIEGRMSSFAKGFLDKHRSEGSERRAFKQEKRSMKKEIEQDTKELNNKYGAGSALLKFLNPFYWASTAREDLKELEADYKDFKSEWREVQEVLKETRLLARETRAERMQMLRQEVASARRDLASGVSHAPKVPTQWIQDFKAEAAAKVLNANGISVNSAGSRDKDQKQAIALARDPNLVHAVTKTRLALGDEGLQRSGYRLISVGEAVVGCTLRGKEGEKLKFVSAATISLAGKVHDGLQASRRYQVSVSVDPVLFDSSASLSAADGAALAPALTLAAYDRITGVTALYTIPASDLTSSVPNFEQVQAKYRPEYVPKSLGESGVKAVKEFSTVLDIASPSSRPRVTDVQRVAFQNATAVSVQKDGHVKVSYREPGSLLDRSVLVGPTLWRSLNELRVGNGKAPAPSAPAPDRSSGSFFTPEYRKQQIALTDDDSVRMNQIAAVRECMAVQTGRSIVGLLQPQGGMGLWTVQCLDRNGNRENFSILDEKFNELLASREAQTIFERLQADMETPVPAMDPKQKVPTSVRNVTVLDLSDALTPEQQDSLVAAAAPSGKLEPLTNEQYVRRLASVLTDVLDSRFTHLSGNVAASAVAAVLNENKRFAGLLPEKTVKAWKQEADDVELQQRLNALKREGNVRPADPELKDAALENRFQQLTSGDSPLPAGVVPVSPEVDPALQGVLESRSLSEEEALEARFAALRQDPRDYDAASKAAVPNPLDSEVVTSKDHSAPGTKSAVPPFAQDDLATIKSRLAGAMKGKPSADDRSISALDLAVPQKASHSR